MFGDYKIFLRIIQLLDYAQSPDLAIPVALLPSPYHPQINRCDLLATVLQAPTAKNLYFSEVLTGGVGADPQVNGHAFFGG